MRVAEWFFDHESAKFPVAVSYEGNLVRRVANWVPFLLLLPALFTLLRKLAYPNERMLIAPSLVLYLLGSVLLGPGLTSNVLFKENWGGRGPSACNNLPGRPPSSPG